MNSVESVRSAESSAAVAWRPRLGFLRLGWIGTHRLAAIGQAGVAEIIAITDPIDDMLAASVVISRPFPAVRKSRPGSNNFSQSKHRLRALLSDKKMARDFAEHGLQTIRARHTCTHRVGEPMSIIAEVDR